MKLCSDKIESFYGRKNFTITNCDTIYCLIRQTTIVLQWMFTRFFNCVSTMYAYIFGCRRRRIKFHKLWANVIHSPGYFEIRSITNCLIFFSRLLLLLQSTIVAFKQIFHRNIATKRLIECNPLILSSLLMQCNPFIINGPK